MGYWRAGYFRKQQDDQLGYWRLGYWRDAGFEVITPNKGGDSSKAAYKLQERRRLQRLYRDDEDVLSIIIAFLTTGGRR